MRSRPLSALAGLGLAATLALGGCAEDSGDSGGSATDASGTACDYPAAANAAKDVDPPPSTATLTGTVDATMSTSVGDLAIALDADAAPCTVNSFVSLAEQGYFDDTVCHRLTTKASGISVLQCGDPTASGMGGPGYSFGDELSGQEKYPAGTVAMANAGPDTNGSQFFLVYDDSPLPAKYTVFGHLDDASLQAVRKVASKGTAEGAPDGTPAEQVAISSVTVDD